MVLVFSIFALFVFIGCLLEIIKYKKTNPFSKNTNSFSWKMALISILPIIIIQLSLNSSANQLFSLISLLFSFASALTSILSVCSFNLAKGFYFAGFMPRTETKIIKLANKSLNEMEIPLIALESPYRIEKTLNILAKDFAEYNICLGRELTKFYEQIIFYNIIFFWFSVLFTTGITHYFNN